MAAKTFKMKDVAHLYVPYYILMGSTVLEDGFFFQTSPLIRAAFLILVELQWVPSNAEIPHWILSGLPSNVLILAIIS